MRHRYPFEALLWLRQQRVDRRAVLLGESGERLALARASAARAEAARRAAEDALSAVSGVELARLDDGSVRAGDLQLVADWQKEALAEVAVKVESERLAGKEQAREAAAEVAARRALAAASNEAKIIDAHRDAFRAQRAAAQERSEEEAAVEQWTASHFPPRRS